VEKCTGGVWGTRKRSCGGFRNVVAVSWPALEEVSWILALRSCPDDTEIKQGATGSACPRGAENTKLRRITLSGCGSQAVGS
jgi:hypothetical protein